MGEIYSLSADDKSIRSQLALSSFIRGMVIKDVLAIVRWVHADGADPKMAICCPIVEVDKDYLFMARVSTPLSPPPFIIGTERLKFAVLF